MKEESILLIKWRHSWRHQIFNF